MKKKHFVKIVTILVTVLLKMTLCLWIYFAFTKKNILSLFKIHTLNFTMYIFEILIWPLKKYVVIRKVSWQLAPAENYSPFRVVVCVKVRVSFRVGGATRQFAPKKIAPRLGLGFGLVLVLRLGAIFLGGNCSRG